MSYRYRSKETYRFWSDALLIFDSNHYLYLITLSILKISNLIEESIGNSARNVSILLRPTCSSVGIVLSQARRRTLALALLLRITAPRQQRFLVKYTGCPIILVILKHARSFLGYVGSKKNLKIYMQLQYV